MWRAGRLPGKSKETWTSGRAAGRQPEEIQGHGDRQQISGCHAGGEEMPLWGGRHMTHWPFRVISSRLQEANLDFQFQATDFIAEAIARKYRDNDYLYYNMIQHKIIMAFEFSEPK